MSHYVDGKPITLSDSLSLLGGSAFLWGYSTFTTALIEDGSWIFGEAHQERLSKSVNHLFKVDLDTKQLLQNLRSAYNHFSPDGNLRIRITYSLAEDNQLVELISITPTAENFTKQGSQILSEKSLVPSSFKDLDLKVGNYSEAMLSLGDLGKEVFFYDGDGHYSEGPIYNVIVFNKKENQWETPINKGHIFSGIGLKYGLKELDIVSKKISIDEKKNYTALVTVNSLRGPISYKQWDNRELTDAISSFEEVKKVFEKNKKQHSIEL